MLLYLFYNSPILNAAARSLKFQVEHGEGKKKRHFCRTTKKSMQGVNTPISHLPTGKTFALK